MATKKTAPAKKAAPKAKPHAKLLGFLDVLAKTIPGFTAPFVSEKKARVINAAAAEAGLVIGALKK